MEDVFQLENLSNSSLVCRAKEVVLENVHTAEHLTCSIGDTIVIDLMAEIYLTKQRYDFGWYIASDGGDALNGKCAVKSLESPTPFNFTTPNSYVSWVNDTSTVDDYCGDVFGETSSSPITFDEMYLGRGLEVACEDLNEDGYLDVSVCFSWRDETTDSVCNPMELYPGSESACDCASYDIVTVIVTNNKTHSTCV
jgi:hypothetical protein